MSIKLSDSIRVGQQKPLEDKYFNELVPYTSTSQVNTLLPKAIRHIGLTVNINKEEYWYKDGIEDANLVLKVPNIDTFILKNQEQDGRLENLEGENASQNDLINDLGSELDYERSRNDVQDSMLGNLEGGLATKLDKGSYPGNAGDLKTEIDGKANTSHTHNISDVTNLQTSLDNKQDNLNSVSGNVGIGILPLSEKLEVDGKVLATGFKIANGGATQTLTANGGVFDLTTKADLVSGKIPASQLPSYVDDVLEYANLASFPATGESGKIYIAIDTNLTYRWGGSSYVVMSSSLALGETSSTAYRGDRGKIAYDHSQLTGNPHNTKLEELTDLGSETTTIADTDVILKKEAVGGLWRKITFANFKSWFTNELAKKINIGLDTVFNFKNISAMTLTEFRSITPNIETIYFTEEQNGTGWQQVRYNGLGITIPATTETLVSLTNENFIELDYDSTFNLIDVANTKIKGIFEKDFVIIKYDAGVETPSTPNQWFKVILKINNVQVASSPIFYLTEPSGTIERISHSFALNVPAEMVTHGATLHLKTSLTMSFNNPAITVVRVHKSTTATL